jgi:hypothetical protein
MVEETLRRIGIALQALERQRATGAVANQALQTRPVGLPGTHPLGLLGLEQPLACHPGEHPGAHLGLNADLLGLAETTRLVELQSALGVGFEHPVNDAAGVVQVGIETRPEAMHEAHRPEPAPAPHNRPVTR